VNGGSGYFDGSGDYLTAPNNSATDLGSGDFTVEAWINTTTTAQAAGIIQKYYGPGVYNGWSFRLDVNNPTTGKLELAVFSGTGKINDGAWHHVAAVRTGTTLSLFVDGVREVTTTNSYNISSTSNVYIGQHFNGAFPYKGYISNIRVIKGSGPYDATSATLAVPTVPLTAITNTSLLCNFTNAGIFDNTGKNNLETVGNAQIDTATKVFGTGSMEFDGTGDYLLVPSSPNLAFGTGDFTVQLWVNSTSFASTPIYLDFRNTNGSATGLVFYATTLGAPVVFINSAIITGSSTMSTGTFHYITITRSGSTVTCYLDGVSVGTASNSTNLSDSKLTIGAAVSFTNLVTGYIDDIRITKGVARDGTVVPTAAFPDL